MVDAIAESAGKVAHAIRLMAAEALDVPPDKIELKDGYVRVADGSNRGMPLRRIAARAHWNPNGLPAGMSAGIYESTMLSPPTLRSPDAEDRIPSAVTYGFVVDLVAVEIERATGRIRIDKYVSVHDVGRQLNPLIVEGQVHGGFAHGLGAALLEELAYDERGNFLSGTFADYLCPTAMEVPPRHHRPCRDAVAHECARRQGHGRRQLDAHAGGDRECGRRRARPRRHHAAVDSAARLGAGERREARKARRRRCATPDHAEGGLRGEGEVVIPAPPSPRCGGA